MVYLNVCWWLARTAVSTSADKPLLRFKLEQEVLRRESEALNSRGSLNTAHSLHAVHGSHVR